MSSTLFDYGFIAELAKHITLEEEREEICDRLWVRGNKLDLNYEGTLLIYNARGHLSLTEQANLYHFQVGALKEDVDEFLKLAHQTGLYIEPKTMQRWSCVWYSGSDRPQRELKLEEFKKHCKHCISI